ncbi:MAG: dTMP kinase [Anaerolineaceae bacterium]|nr:dTMP kinase [Anaerolineaceae bacterium]
MFITIEGPEGGGKTSHIAPLADFLSKLGYNISCTREPGGTDIGDQVRAVLTRHENINMHPRTETLLFLAARAQLVEQCIRPGLSQGHVVISDRYADSTLAYQGYGHGNDLEMLRNLLNFATGDLWPDLTFLLDIQPEQGLQRKRSGGEWNRLDAYTLAFHQRVWQGYHELVRQDPQRWVIIDASQPFDTVQNLLRQDIVQRLSEKAGKKF